LRVRASPGRPGRRSPRDILVALPPGYQEDRRHYPVVYLHDGQNLFDPATSFAGDWGLVATLNQLALEGVTAIAVGIPNRGRRRRYEYSPFRDILHGGGGGDRYLAFLVETLKPLIDTSFRTQPGRDHTVIAGSSLGGLISLYALYRSREVFGAAGVLSPALWFADRAIFRFLEAQPAGPAGRIHLDVGTDEGTSTLEQARELRAVLRNAGYVEGRDLEYLEEPGAGHNEEAWGRRFRDALPFLLGTGDWGLGTGELPSAGNALP
jgi:predicted alpha/beta superfamily hydrolase